MRVSQASRNAAFEALEERIVACERCPELRAYCARVAREKKLAHRNDSYWGRPVPAFGNAAARVLLVGLAPGAHGSNRTGRMFTGDASGVWLFRALYRAGFASQATQRDRDDGLTLRDATITAALRCAPPQNKPTPEQLRRCFPYLVEELALMARLRVVIGLGAIGTRAAETAGMAAGANTCASASKRAENAFMNALLAAGLAARSSERRASPIKWKSDHAARSFCVNPERN